MYIHVNRSMWKILCPWWPQIMTIWLWLIMRSCKFAGDIIMYLRWPTPPRVLNAVFRHWEVVYSLFHLICFDAGVLPRCSRRRLAFSRADHSRFGNALAGPRQVFVRLPQGCHGWIFLYPGSVFFSPYFKQASSSVPYVKAYRTLHCWLSWIHMCVRLICERFFVKQDLTKCQWARTGPQATSKPI